MEGKHTAYEYRVRWSDEDDLFIGSVTEFPLLSSHGETYMEALDEIVSVVGFVVEEMAQQGADFPTPLGSRQYSGRFNMRVPKDMHRALVMDAARQGVSLNTLIISRLQG